MRCACCALTGLLLLGAGTAKAGDLWHDFWRDYDRNNCWPQPFVHVDRAAALQPWAMMEAKGWQRQNLLGAHHFVPNSAELSPAGKLKVEWILTQAPANRRVIFIERSAGGPLTAGRIETLHRVANDLSLPGQPVAIFESRMMTEGWPAEAVDRTNVRFLESRPTPALPAATAGGTGE